MRGLRVGLALCVWLGCAALAQAVPAYVQSVSCNGFGGATLACTFTTANNTTGNMLIASGFNAATSGTITFTDGASNTYTAIGAGTAGFGFSLQSACAPITAGGGTKITVTAAFSAGAGNQTLILTEGSGLDAACATDGSSYANTTFGTGTDAFSPGSITTTADGDWIYGAIADSNGNATAFSAGTGFTRRESYTFDGGGRFAASEDAVQTTHGAIAATFTNTVAGAIGIQVGIAFKASGGGGGGCTARPRLPLAGVGGCGS